MEFTHRGLLWLGLVVPALFYVGVRRRPRAIPMPGLSGLPRLPRAQLRLLPPLMLALASLMFLAAASGPRIPISAEDRKVVGVDVALALDVSGSMRAEDFRPNRMEAAKSRIKEFVTKFREGRMALVAFAGRSFTQCPLTPDGEILAGLLEQLDAGSVAIDGTAIGDAIINCINKFKEDAVIRVIILLTDGENNAGSVDPITAARAAAAKGIRIYTIGVGTPEGAPMPMYNPAGEKFYLRDPMGNLVLAKVDEKGLMAIADITGGQYFRAKDEDALRDVYSKIAKMEKKEITIKRLRGYRELFPYFTGAGLVLMFSGAALAAGRFRVLQ